MTATLGVKSATCFGTVVAITLLFGLPPARAQTPANPVSGVDGGLIEDIVVGSRILADFGVVDGFGHVSARHPTNPNHFLMSRSLAHRRLLPPTTSWSSISTETPWMRAAGRCFWSASSMAKSTRRGRM